MKDIVLAGQISGTRNGQEWPPPGTTLSLDDAEADALVKSGMAYDPDDERVKSIGGKLAGFSDEMIAGAPTGHDSTEGQPETNLARANALALDERDTREVTREAAERVDGPSVVKNDDDQGEEFGKVETATIDQTPAGKPTPKSTRK